MPPRASPRLTRPKTTPAHSLERFLQRVGRHPKLSRTEVFQAFLESTEWVRQTFVLLLSSEGNGQDVNTEMSFDQRAPAQNVFKHKHHARSTSQDESNHGGGGVLDSLSDTLLNAFTKLKKPDERFVVIRQHLDSFEEGLASLERLAARSKTRMGDLSGDYEDLAVSVQGLGYLESGITDPLMRFERALVDFGANVKDHSALSTETFLEHVHSLLGYSHAFKGVLKLRDQKQLDFEELSAYLSNVVVERDRLANGYGYGMGLGSYFKEKVESLRGGETDMSRAARLHRLDAKIKEVRRRLFVSFSSSLQTSPACCTGGNMDSRC